MSRQGNEPESQIVLKRPRQEDRPIQHSFNSKKHSLECPWFRHVPGHPRGPGSYVWMSNLIQSQDGCLQMVAQRVNMGRVQQEQLAQNVAQRAMMSSTSYQVSYLRAQLAHREAHLDQVRAGRDNHFVQEEEEEVLASHICQHRCAGRKIQVEVSSQNLRMCSTPHLQVEVHHGFYLLR